MNATKKKQDDVILTPRFSNSMNVPSDSMAFEFQGARNSKSAEAADE